MRRPITRLIAPCLAAPLLAVAVAAAGPYDRGLSLSVPARPDLPGSATAPSAPPPLAFQPAPLPNRDIDGPTSRSGNGTSVSPSLFTRTDTYRGDAFGSSNSAQIDQDKRAKPAAGFSLKMPLTPQ